MQRTFYMFTTMIFVWTAVAFITPGGEAGSLTQAQFIISTFSALYAGLFVITASSLIQDVIKSGIMLVLTIIIAVASSGMSFLILVALIAGASGTWFNYMCQKVSAGKR